MFGFLQGLLKLQIHPERRNLLLFHSQKSMSLELPPPLGMNSFCLVIRKELDLQPLDLCICSKHVENILAKGRSFTF